MSLIHGSPIGLKSPGVHPGQNFYGFLESRRRSKIFTRRQWIQDQKIAKKIKIGKKRTIKESNGVYLIISWDKLLGLEKRRVLDDLNGFSFLSLQEQQKKASRVSRDGYREIWIPIGKKENFFEARGVDRLVRIGSPGEIEEMISLGGRLSISWRLGGKSRNEYIL